jgi:hypothetical protein
VVIMHKSERALFKTVSMLLAHSPTFSCNELPRASVLFAHQTFCTPDDRILLFCSSGRDAPGLMTVYRPASVFSVLTFILVLVSLTVFRVHYSYSSSFHCISVSVSVLVLVKVTVLLHFMVHGFQIFMPMDFVVPTIKFSYSVIHLYCKL